MKLVISQALPPATIADGLFEPLVARYPKVAHLFNARHAEPVGWSLQQHGCTPDEALELESVGYNPPSGQPIGAGLGPLQAKVVSPAMSVWIAEICSTVLSQERATVLPQKLIQTTAQEIEALEHSARPLFDDHGDGIRIEPMGNGLWQVHAEFAQTGNTISPMALLGQDLGDWWPTAHMWRLWRKRVNEIQMAWHDHPVNQAREDKGLPAINGIWLYGGGKGFTPAPSLGYQTIDHLSEAAWRGNWSEWLDAWVQIEPILMNAAPQQEIILTGQDRTVRLVNAPSRWWRNLFARGQQDAWRNWWLNRN